VPLCLPPALAAISHLRELDLDSFCGVYFLCDGDEVVYVGKSLVAFSRALSHRKTKEFDRVFFLRTPESDLLAIERQFIESLKPRLNVVFNAPAPVTDEAAAASGVEPIERAG
jgi:excinuclease UvrABC nuclease subunit